MKKLERISTTFMLDFGIANTFAKRNHDTHPIVDTYDRVFMEWRKDIRYVCELYLCLNQYCWAFYSNAEKIDTMLEHPEDVKNDFLREALATEKGKANAIMLKEFYTEISRLYQKLFYQVHDYVYSDAPKNFSAEEVKWFFDITD